MIRRVALLITSGLLTSSCAALGVTTGCDGTEVIAFFEQVGDLVQAANVQSSDVKIGSIPEIELDHEKWHARITMCIDEKHKIPSDLEAVVRTTSLLGEKFIDLKPLSDGPPFLQDGDIIGVDRTSKATELEDVFAELAEVVGVGNLHQINTFTTAQAKILRNNAGDLKEVLSRLRQFSDVLVSRKGDIASAIDSLDDFSKNALANQAILERFLDSFDDASAVLANQKEGLQALLSSLERFTTVGIALLDATDEGLTKQFAKLRPVLRTVVSNAKNLRTALRTLATFTQWFPETMPGDYLQLDVCQALETHTQGTTCPQSVQNDDPKAAGSSGEDEVDDSAPQEDDLEEIFRIPLRSDD
ncbi:MAG: MCE family protein [Actinomycetota bacterium]|nr:MCE family protein [Actinomycetota bacterium]